MSEQVETIDADASVADARERMRGQEVRHLVVLRGGDVLGIVSERDLSRAARARGSQSDVSAAMSAPVVAAFPETTVRQAANLMRGRSIGCLPVVRDGDLVGIVTVSDLLDLLGKNVRRAPPTAQHWEEKHRGRRRARYVPGR